MQLFVSNSRKARNRDGTYNVYCASCRRFIAITTVNLGKTLCELCQRVEDGGILTEQMVRDYEAGKLDRAEIAYLSIPSEPEPIKALGSRLRTMGGGLMHAMGLKKEPPVDPVRSRKAAAAASRRRVFDSPDSIRSLQDVDAALNKPRGDS